ncbi:MAG: hypothetical protein PUG10_08850 [Lachnospiraceae bacterium]|nr:hypothetical protein [Lachnospiraceae bacterium]
MMLGRKILAISLAFTIGTTSAAPNFKFEKRSNAIYYEINTSAEIAIDSDSKTTEVVAETTETTEEEKGVCKADDGEHDGYPSIYSISNFVESYLVNDKLHLELIY